MIVFWGLPASRTRAPMVRFVRFGVPLRYGFARRTMVRPAHTSQPLRVCFGTARFAVSPPHR